MTTETTGIDEGSDGELLDDLVTLNGETGKVGYVKLIDGTESSDDVITSDGSGNLNVKVNGTVPVSGTFYQATQPVSGTFWQATQPVSGTFWQATQPVSIATAPVLVAGSAIIGKVGIDQTTPGTTNKVSIGTDGTVAVTGTVTVGSHAVTNAGTFAVQAAEADGANVTLGAKADAKSTATDTTAISAMSVLKQISASVQAPPSQAVTNAGTFATQADITKVAGSTISQGHGTAAAAIRVELPTDGTGIVGLAAGTNAIGKLAANNGVDIGDVTLTAGSAIVGQVGIDQTTPGTTNKVSIGTDGTVATTTANYSAKTTMQNAVSATANGTSLTVSGYAMAALQLSGTFSATVTFEISMDAGTTWVGTKAKQSTLGNWGASATNAGIYHVITAGADLLRARVTWTSGTSITVVGQAITAAGLPWAVQIDSLGNTVAISGTVATAEAAPTAVLNGKKTVTTAGTRVTLASTTTCKSVTIKALAANTGTIYVGNSSVASTNGFALSPGDTVTLDIADLNTVNLDSSVNGEGVTYLGVN